MKFQKYVNIWHFWIQKLPQPFMSSDGLSGFVKLNILQSIVLLLISMQSDQENKNKAKNKAIDSIVSKREKIHQNMQLWSNVYENEYALSLAIADAAQLDQITIN